MRPGNNDPSNPFHRAERTHAAIALVAAALEQFDFARGFLGPGEQSADHHRRRAGNQRLADVARVTDAAVRDQWNAILQGIRHHRDRGDLRDADAGDDARGTDRTRAHADLDRAGTGIHQRERRITGDDVAADHLQARETFRGPCDAIDHALRMSVRGVDDDDVDASGDQRFDSLLGIATDTDRGTDQQAFAAVVSGIRIVGFLLDVLDGDQPAQLRTRR